MTEGYMQGLVGEAIVRKEKHEKDYKCHDSHQRIDACMNDLLCKKLIDNLP